MNKLIILGGSGYVGRSIIEYLNSKKNQSHKIKKKIISVVFLQHIYAFLINLGKIS